MLTSFLIAAVGTSVVMWVLWLVQIRTKDASSVDAAWALCIGAAALWYATSGSGDTARGWLAASLGAVWGLRLGGHLLIDRVITAKAEDGRYRAMRDHWGTKANLHFSWFYQGQTLAVLLFSAVFLVAANDPRPLGVVDYAAVGWWLCTIVLVAIADRQLARWRANPANAGRTCRAGLWRWSRHPNYFFEWLHWPAYVALAWGGPWGPATIAIPIVLLLLLLFVTGIPYVEARAIKTRGDDYRAYQRETSMFIPLPPRTTG